MATKELTEQEQQDRQEICYGLHQQVCRELHSGRQVAWRLAQALHEWDEAAGYVVLGYETLGNWLADPEIGLTRSTYYRLVKSYRGLQIRRVPDDTMAELDPTKVDVVLPAIEKGRTTLTDALADVRALGWRDLREKYLGKRPQAKSRQEPEPEDEIDESIDSTGTVIEDEDAVAHDLDDALSMWSELREELMMAAVSGQEYPRISARNIRRGVAGVDAIMERGDELAARGGKVVVDDVPVDERTG